SRGEEFCIDIRVLLFAFGVSLLAGVAFGLVPAVQISRRDLQESLKQGERGTSGTRHRVQGAFIVVEMALSLVLLAGAGLMLRSLVRLWSVDPGFNPSHVLTFGYSLPPAMMQASPDAVRSAFREFDRRVQSIPGVRAVSQSWGAIPMSGDDERLFLIEGQPKPKSQNEMN